jgi:hypothetical protein
VTPAFWKEYFESVHLKIYIKFVNITKVEVHVSHFPPGTSKWNKIEHKIFCFISKNWRGRPLISVETVIELISNTTTSKGLKIVCVEDSDKYELGTKVTDEDMVGQAS